MKIPAEIIENFVTSEFPEAKLTSTGEWTVNSFLTHDTKRKLYIHKDSGVYIDFKSSDNDVGKGSFLKLVKEYKGLNSNYDALQYLIDNYNFKLKKSIKETKEEINNSKIIEEFIVKDKPIFFKNPDKLGIFGKKAYNYVLNRKLDESYYPNLGYVFNSYSRYNERIVIPFFEKERLVYFITRAVDKNNPLRYLNADKLDSKQFLFNIDKINDEVIICEGTFDAMSITADQAATCLLSADISVKQLEKLFEKKPNTIIYVPDQDKTGLLKMRSNINKIISYCPYSGLNIYIFTVPNGCKDLNEMKIKTGKNFILKKECEKYGANLFSRSIF